MNTATAEEVEALPDFIKSKILSSFERWGRIKHAENKRGAKPIEQRGCYLGHLRTRLAILRRQMMKKCDEYGHCNRRGLVP
ncbi:hypothetical protein [Nitrobacter sp. TKz-YC02]|uniref:hypothetical protein n=1 Tax=Nitrobacter sp. TKz-YC02 TaxID=3398704 RepID=UPI003CE9F975